MKTCCICGKNFEGFGNNPEPLQPFNNGENVCCDDCNKGVIAARIARATGNASPAPAVTALYDFEDGEFITTDKETFSSILEYAEALALDPSEVVTAAVREFLEKHGGAA